MDGGATSVDGRLSIGDKLVNVKTRSFNKNLENVSHEDAVATLKAIIGHVILTVQKPDMVQTPLHLNQNNSLSMGEINDMGNDYGDGRTQSPTSTNVLSIIPPGTPRAVSNEDITRFVRSSATYVKQTLKF